MVGGDRVAVNVGDTVQFGFAREEWFGPVTGASIIVDLDGGGMVIAPVASVRRLDESEL